MTPNDRQDDQLARMSDYLDGSLSAEQQAALEAALAADPAGRAQLAAFRRIDELVKTAAGPAPELDWPDFVQTARMRREATVPRSATFRWRRWVAPLTAAAAVALLVSAGIWWNAVQTPRGPGAAEASVALVSIARTTVEADRDSVAIASLVRSPHGSRVLAQVGPPLAPRTLIVAVAGRPGDRPDNGSSDEDAGVL